MKVSKITFRKPSTQQLRNGVKSIKPLSRLDYFIQHHVKLFTFIISLLILWRFVVECQNKNFTVLPITVPQELDTRGYNSSAVTDKIFEEIRKITNLTPSASSRGAVLLNLVSFNQTSIVRLEDNYDGYFDVRGLFKAAKTIVNIHDRAVVGHIVETEQKPGQKGLALFLKINNQAIETPLRVPQVSMIDSLLSLAAIEIIKYTNPKFLARSLIYQHKIPEAKQVLTFGRILAQREEEEEAVEPNESDYIQDRVMDIFLLLHNIDHDENESGDFDHYLTNCDSALIICDHLRREYPRDIAAYVLKVAILKSKALHIIDYKSHTDPRISESCRQGIETYHSYEKKWWKTCNFFDKNRALGMLNASFAFFNYETRQGSEAYIKSIFDKAISYLPDNAHVYNDLIYFYVSNEKYEIADSMAAYILSIHQFDNNIWDTRAEINYKMHRMDSFYQFLHRAVTPPNKLLGFTPEGYKNDIRWQNLCGTPEYKKAIGLK